MNDDNQTPDTLPMHKSSGLKTEIRDTSMIVTLTPEDVVQDKITGTTKQILAAIPMNSTLKSVDKVVIDLSGLEYDDVKTLDPYKPKQPPAPDQLDFKKMLSSLRAGVDPRGKKLIFVVKAESGIMDMFVKAGLPVNWINVTTTVENAIKNGPYVGRAAS